ncbi:MAG: hypothetical protein ACTHMM_10100 [Agriterribacter sp.]
MNGFLNIEIKGKTVGLKFGMYLTEMLSEESKKRPIFTDGNMNHFGLSNLLYYAYHNNCIAKRLDPDPELEFEVFYDYAESALMDSKVKKILEECVKEWVASKPMEAILKDQKPTEKKRPAASRKSGK